MIMTIVFPLKTTSHWYPLVSIILHNQLVAMTKHYRGPDGGLKSKKYPHLTFITTFKSLGELPLGSPCGREVQVDSGMFDGLVIEYEPDS